MQAGTGTGKSLAYLVPALAHALETGQPVVVSTATLALQAQVIDRDLPRLATAVTPLLGRRPTYALVKGRRNYLCKHKLVGGFPAEEDTLFDLPGEAAPAPGPAGRRGGPAAGVGRPDPDRRPRRAGARRERTRLAAGVGVGARVPGLEVPGCSRSASPSRRGPTPGWPTSS